MKKTKRDFKKDFESWFTKKGYVAYGKITSGVFEVMPNSMQWGVKVDFYESVGMYVSVLPLFKENGEFNTFMFNIIKDKEVLSESVFYKTQPEARDKALEKAKELY